MATLCHVHVAFTVHRNVDEFKRKAAAMIEIIKKSPGCITSGLLQELGGDTFAIIETWETEAACDEDAAGDHVQCSPLIGAGLPQGDGRLGHLGPEEVRRGVM